MLWSKKSKADLERELTALRKQHQSLVVKTNYYQSLAVELGNQVERWMRMHQDLLKATSEESPDLRSYADSVAQTIRESYPDPAALIAAVSMTQANTQGVFTSDHRRIINGKTTS